MHKVEGGGAHCTATCYAKYFESQNHLKFSSIGAIKTAVITSTAAEEAAAVNMDGLGPTETRRRRSSPFPLGRRREGLVILNLAASTHLTPMVLPYCWCYNI